MEREKLKSENERVYTESGCYLFTVSFTDKARSLINDEGRNEGESWIDFRNRTKGEREQEQLIRENTAKEIADAYNEKYFK